MFGSWDKFMASSFQLVAALLQGKGWLGGSLRLQAGHYAMLLVEQGVLWVLPMLWLVLLLSEEAGAATATTGSRLLGAPEGRGGGGQGPNQDSPLPQRLHWVCPRVVWTGMGRRLRILTGARVDEPECGCEQGPNEEGTKGDTQHRGQDEAFACVAKGRSR